MFWKLLTHLTRAARNNIGMPNNFGKEGRSFGFYLSRELDDCGKDIMAVFGVTDFYRDYEDTWEWVEGGGADGLHVNVSRTHNWKAGNYDCPVHVRIIGPAARLAGEFLSLSGQRLADQLKTEVWLGSAVVDDRGQNYCGFEIKQKFTPMTKSN